MTLRGLVDLHCHYLPSVDDGVRTHEDGVALCQALARLGYDTVVATPHIRPGMFDNHKADLQAVFAAFVESAANEPDMPATGLAAEHFCDSQVLELFEHGSALPYPGGHAALIEFPPERFPLGVAQRFFRLNVRGIRPVIAHPERYEPLFRSSEAIEPLVDSGSLLLLDLMSLTGKYGKSPRRAAERMLDEELYFAACSDSHKPADVPVVAQGIERLLARVGSETTALLLGEHPRRILAGTVSD